MFIHYSQEGSSYDRGLYARCFEELFDLANLDTTSTSQYKFCVTVCELYNEQVSFSFQLPCTPFLSCLCFTSRFLFHLGLLNFSCKLLLCAFESGKNMPTLSFGADECFVELVQEKVNNPLEFTTVLKTAFRNRGNDLLKINVSHLYGLHSLSTSCVAMVVLYHGFIYYVLSCMINLY
jgi:hypothetical protein